MGSARRQRSCVGASPPHHLRHRSSKVEFNLAAIPPHLCRGEPRQKCFGRPGHGRPGRWHRQCQSSQICSATSVAAQNPRCQPQTAPVSAPFSQACRPLPSYLRSTVLPASASLRRAFIRGAVPVREDRHLPHQRRCRAHRVGRPGPGPGGRLPNPSAACLCRRPGA